MSTKDGGSAFPSEQHECADGTWNQTFDPGMTLRDYFAGQALAGMLAKPVGSVRTHATLALDAYRMADAMLAERERGR